MSLPPSRSETEKAIIVGSLASGRSRIYNDLRCAETYAIRDACKRLGSQFVQHQGFIDVIGNDGKIPQINGILDSKKSGLIFRLYTALASIGEHPFAISGDERLQSSTIQSLLLGLRQLGAEISKVSDDGMTHLVNWGGGLQGGNCSLLDGVGPHVLTALLLCAPFSRQPVTIETNGKVLSKADVQQTISTMTAAGISVNATKNLSRIVVHPGRYAPLNACVNGDDYLASLFLAAAAIVPGVTILKNIDPQGRRGEKQFLDFLTGLGLVIRRDNDNTEVLIDSRQGLRPGCYEFDASNCPRLAPALAALGAHIDGSLRVTGASNAGKGAKPAIRLIATELESLGVNVAVITKYGLDDGFQVRKGSGDSYAGGVYLRSWGDHLALMPLFVASLKGKSPVLLDKLEAPGGLLEAFMRGFRELGIDVGEIGEARLNRLAETA